MRLACALVVLLGGCTLPTSGLGLAAPGDGGSDASARDAGPPGFDAGPPGFDAGPPGVDAGPVPPGVDGGPGLDAGGCAGASCTGDTLTTCAPDGTMMTDTCALGCATSGPPRCQALVPSNVDPALFTASADLVIDQDIDTDSCALGMPASQLGGGSQVCLLRGVKVSVPSGANVRVTGSRPLIVLAVGNAVIEGTLDVSARGESPGPGGGAGGDNSRPNGIGPHPGNGGPQNGFSEGGGGGGGYCGDGGNGGVGGSAAGGGGGGVVGSGFNLTPLVGGSGGGRGGGDTAVLGRGGAGGGALQISAGISLSVTGRILAGGGGGDGGGSLACGVNAGAAGGGGSGGAVLLESPEVTLGAAATITTSGGGGGGSSNGCRMSDDGGTDGTDGRTTAGRAAPGVGNGSYSNRGGYGGGGTNPDAEDGQAATIDGGNGGGGGGGAGCVLVRQRSGTLPTGGTVSADHPDAYRAMAAVIQ